MKKKISCFVLIAILLPVLVQTQAQAATWSVIQAGRVIVDAREPALGPTTIIVRDKMIDRLVPGLVGAEAVTESGEGDRVRVIDLRDRTILPGLIDTHVHLAADPDAPYWETAVRNEADDAVRATVNAAVTVKAGFTTVRDLGSGPTSVFAVRDAVNNGIISGPRIVASGMPLTIMGGHGDINGFSRPVYDALADSLSPNVCTGADECALHVREASKFGADVIKFTSTGGVLSQQGRGLGKHFTDAEMESIVNTARQLGLKVAAHSHGGRGIEGAANAGVDSIEHGTFADQAALKAMKKHNAFMVPTLMAFKGIEARLGTGIYTPTVEVKVRETLSALGAALKAANKMGIRTAFGTDAGVFAHGSNAEEFALMTEYGGMTPQETLIAATVNAATLMGLEKQIGTIEPGKSADFVATVESPLENIKTLEEIVFVMARGTVALTDTGEVK